MMVVPEGEHPEKSGATDGQIVQNVHNLKKGCISSLSGISAFARQ
jgi:hypothetical protein